MPVCSMTWFFNMRCGTITSAPEQFLAVSQLLDDVFPVMNAHLQIEFAHVLACIALTGGIESASDAGCLKIRCTDFPVSPKNFAG